jgi:hypothetical protein
MRCGRVDPGFQGGTVCLRVQPVRPIDPGNEVTDTDTPHSTERLRVARTTEVDLSM